MAKYAAFLSSPAAAVGAPRPDIKPLPATVLPAGGANVLGVGDAADDVTGDGITLGAAGAGAATATGTGGAGGADTGAGAATGAATGAGGAAGTFGFSAKEGK